MIPEIDIYRAAGELIKKCGENESPKEYANTRIKQCCERGNVYGAAVWTEIRKAVDNILETSPSGTVH
jgi:hypothetical protein